MRVAAALWLLLLPVTAAAQSVTARATASKTDVTVGETFTVEVRGVGPEGTVWTFPVQAGNEKVELRALQAAASPAPPAGSLRYEATVFALEGVAVPAIDVQYRLPDGSSGRAATEPIELRIVSAVPKDTPDPTIADIRPPVALTIGRAFWIALAAGVALLLGIGWWLWNRRRPAVAAAPAPVPVITAEAEALQALDRLAAARLLEDGEYRPFYIALTDVMKRYLERRLDAPVREMTTAEMLSWMRDAAVVSDRVPLARDVAGAADRIKFARGEGLADEARRHLADVRQLVADVETRLRPVPVAAARKDVA